MKLEDYEQGDLMKPIRIACTIAGVIAAVVSAVGLGALVWLVWFLLH